MRVEACGKGFNQRFVADVDLGERLRASDCEVASLGRADDAVIRWWK